MKHEAAGTGRLPFFFCDKSYSLLTGHGQPTTVAEEAPYVWQPLHRILAFSWIFLGGVGALEAKSKLTSSRPRRDNRSANGTVTLRRSSTTPHGIQPPQSSQPETAAPLPTTETPFSQQQQYASEPAAGGRYSKNILLDIYRSQPDHTNGSVSRLFVNSWDPGHSNGSNGRGWGKSTDTRDHNHGPEICWDSSGQVQPIGLEEMSPLEKNVSGSGVVMEVC